MIHVFFTFISGIIVNKERVSSVQHPPFASLFGTNLAQLGPYYTALNIHRRSLFIRDPLVAATGNSSVGYAMYSVFGRNLTKITNEWVERENSPAGDLQRHDTLLLPDMVLGVKKGPRIRLHGGSPPRFERLFRL